MNEVKKGRDIQNKEVFFSGTASLNQMMKLLRNSRKRI
jgi:hypothetical protein